MDSKKISIVNKNEIEPKHKCDTDNSPDVIGYPNSDKIGIAIKGKPNKLYKNNAVVDYYDGE